LSAATAADADTAWSPSNVSSELVADMSQLINELRISGVILVREDVLPAVADLQLIEDVPWDDTRNRPVVESEGWTRYPIERFRSRQGPRGEPKGSWYRTDYFYKPPPSTSLLLHEPGADAICYVLVFRTKPRAELFDRLLRELNGDTVAAFDELLELCKPAKNPKKRKARGSKKSKKRLRETQTPSPASVADAPTAVTPEAATGQAQVGAATSPSLEANVMVPDVQPEQPAAAGLLPQAGADIIDDFLQGLDADDLPVMELPPANEALPPQPPVAAGLPQAGADIIDDFLLSWPDLDDRSVSEFLQV
jgi:hypothetical protein